MKSPVRVKVRNCIRPDTFRYHLYEKNMLQLWTVLQSHFGCGRQFGSLDLYEINHKGFLLRVMFKQATITVVKKKNINETEIQHFHQLIGFEGV